MHAIESNRPTLPPSAGLVPCGLGCRYAEPLRDTYADWVWCRQVAVVNRLRRIGSDCRWFESGANSEPPPTP